jgi:hypothetical protein
MDYCSVIKKNEIMLFAKIWMELETIILSKQARLRKINIACFLSYAESSPKKDKFKMRALFGGGNSRRRRVKEQGEWSECA